METLKPKVGSYFILDAFNKICNGVMMPVATVKFRDFSWSKFGDNEYEIRLQGLYNRSSEGPKTIGALDLIFHIVNIREMEEFKDPQNSTRIIRRIIWDAEKSNDYNTFMENRADALEDFDQVDPELEEAIADLIFADIEHAKNEVSVTMPFENDDEVPEDDDIPF